VVTLYTAETIAKKSALTVKVEPKLSASFISSFVKADALIDFATLKVFSNTDGVRAATPLRKENIFYLSNLTNGNRDNVLTMLPTADGQAGRVLKIYNPRAMDIQVTGIDNARFTVSYDAATSISTITLLASPAKSTAYEAALEFRPEASAPGAPTVALHTATISAKVVPKQKLLVDFDSLKAQLGRFQADLVAWAALNPFNPPTPPAGTPVPPPPAPPPGLWDLTGLTAATDLLGAALQRGGMYRNFLISLGWNTPAGAKVWSEAQWTTFKDALKLQLDEVYKPYIDNNVFSWNFGATDASVSNIKFESRTFLQAKNLPSTDTLVAGRPDISNGWADAADVDLSATGLRKVLTGSGAATTVDPKFSASELRYTLESSLNTNLTDAPYVIIDAFMRSIRDSNSATAANSLGLDMGWLIAHEFGHSVGLMDEYEVGTLSNNHLTGAVDSTFMKEYGVKTSNATERAELRGSFHDATPSGAALNALSNYLAPNSIMSIYVALGAKRGSIPSPDARQQPGPDAGASQVVSAVTLSTSPLTLQRAQDALPAAPATGLHYAVDIGSTLVNAGFNSGDGWNLHGAVAIGDGAAVLSETAGSQSHLSQAFVLGEHDRFLTFTLDHIELDDAAAGPDDAFEVALLDAHTGLPLFGEIGLTRSDAAINLQADGRQFKAQRITGVLNQNGSRTYRIDLTGLAAGTALDLSFDLIGFGATAASMTSSVTIRNLGLEANQVQLVDDVAVLDEDGTAVIAGLANDLNVQPGFAPVVVAAPTHGQVSVNADGTFSYAPAANWYGEDSFTYKLSDGLVDAGLATVRLTVNPINDAPLAHADAGQAQEDGGDVVFAPADLLANDSDVDGDVLTIVAVGASASGAQVALVDGKLVYAVGHLFQSLAAGQNASDTFSYTVTDGDGMTSIATVSMTIAGANDAPVAQNDVGRVREDASLVSTGNVLDNDADVDAGTLLAVAAPGIYRGVYGTLTIAADGNYRYELDNSAPALQSLREGDVVNEVFSYQLSDGIASASAQLLIAITGSNDGPVLTDDAAEVQEDGVLGAAGNLLGNDHDTDTGTVLTVAAPGTYAGMYGSLTLGADGAYVYTLGNGSAAVQSLRAGQKATDVFTYLASDGIVSVAALLTVTVTGANDGPQALADSGVAREDGGAVTFNAIDLLANDTDSDAGDSKSLVSVENSDNGVQVRLVNGVVVYDIGAHFQNLAQGEQLTDTFVYTMADASGATSSTRVSMTITGTNDAPQASASAVTGVEDMAYLFRWSDFNAGDVDRDAALSLVLGSLPADGQLQLLDGAWTAVAAGQTIARADIDAGRLRFMPAANASSSPAYAYAGFGNGRQHYAQFNYQISDGQLRSALTAMTVDVAPVTDAPLLTIGAASGGQGAAAELFRTGWESVVTHGAVSTLVHASTLEGWNLVTGYGNQHVFEIWSNGDKMPDGQGGPSTVYAGDGNGRNWLSLNDGNGNGHDTLGIERSVETRAGATYTLSFDYAGQVGAPVDYTRIGIYVDGVKLATFANTSPAAALAWQTLSFQFAGKGKARTIRIVTEPSATVANGRGAMIDDIALTEQWGLNTGYVNAAIRLAPVSASLVDMDGSEALALVVQGMPAGAILSDGTHSFTATAGSTSVDVSVWNWSALSIKAPSNFVGSFALTVTAVAIERVSGQAVSTTKDLVVTVKAAPGGAPCATSASIVVPSRARVGAAMAMEAQGMLYVANGIVGSKAELPAPVIDWSAAAPHAGPGIVSRSEDEWLAAFLGACGSEQDLSMTGLHLTLGGQKGVR
jgi:VCBS repeat-containing protein